MEYNRLGNTSLEVSRLCFGALTIGPLQANLKPEIGGELISQAIEKGVNFIDTAELYETYPHIREGLKRSKSEIVIASRSYAYTRQMAIDSIEKARHELDRDVIEIFGLHQQESEHTLRGHREAIEYFIEAKQKGIIKALLITTHHVNVVEHIANMPEIDIIHPIFNISGLGIADGTVEEMSNAIKLAHSRGKGVYSMKPFGGGNLLKNYNQCLGFVLGFNEIDSVAIGIKNEKELNANIDYFNGKSNNESFDVLSDKKLHIDYWCEKCGNCVKRCPQNALKIKNDTVVVDNSKCILCGYCGSVCPQFAIKIV